jgi:hypothetical protein
MVVSSKEVRGGGQLWLGHESSQTTHQYVEADLMMFGRAARSSGTSSASARAKSPATSAEVNATATAADGFLENSFPSNDPLRCGARRAALYTQGP